MFFQVPYHLPEKLYLLLHKKDPLLSDRDKALPLQDY